MSAPGVCERLLVFARAPSLGRVKTRLTPPLTQQQALDLHRALVEDTLERLGRFQRSGLERWLYLSEPSSEEQLDVGPAWRSALQASGDLGERMEHAFREADDGEFHRVVIVGSDSPTLPLRYLAEAYDALAVYDVVLGPAEDGGYYLVGTSRFVPDLWRDIKWGSSRVLDQSTEALSRAGRSFHLLPPWYDVDTGEDLERLAKELSGPPAAQTSELPRRTAAVLESFFRKRNIPS